MTPDSQKQKEPSAESPAKPEAKRRPGAEQADLDDWLMQEKYRKAYLAELRARQCPGCSEDNLF